MSGLLGISLQSMKCTDYQLWHPLPQRQPLLGGFSHLAPRSTGTWCHRIVFSYFWTTHVVIITVRTILVALLVRRHVLSERLFAFFTHEGHFGGFCESMCLWFSVAFSTIIPLFAAWCTNGDLSIEDVFTACVEDDQLVHWLFEEDWMAEDRLNDLRY